MANVKYLYGPVNVVENKNHKFYHKRATGLAVAFRNDILQHFDIAKAVGLIPLFGGFGESTPTGIRGLNGNSVSTNTVTPDEFRHRTSATLGLAVPWVMRFKQYSTVWPIVLLLPENVEPRPVRGNTFERVSLAEAMSMIEGYPQ